MNKLGWIAFLFVVAWCLCVQAAEQPSAATRAYLYQREARTVLLARGWRILRDENGKLIAHHPLAVLSAAPMGKLELANSPTTANPWLHALAKLTLTFQSESINRTKCGANIVAYSVWDGANPNKPLKPFPFNNPDTTKEIQGMMAAAEQAMTAKHPEYAAK